MCAKKLLIMAVIFAIVASPMTYGITRDIFGSWVASPSGCATQGGVLLHAAVFAGALYLLWKLSKKKGWEGLSPMSGDGRVCLAWGPAPKYGKGPASKMPASMYQAPAQMYQEPAQMYQEPAQMYQAPAQMYQAPAQMYQAPAQMYRAPVIMYRKPAPKY